ncbi:MAG TPA: ankyrin repeat domain-containing protein [Verrucomicrobiae bacterium]|nr:ankyrin repeat domain-containing protein [Verrucomicrobiae bacterium]
MSTSKLPARPSLESLRKQAKRLARDIVAGDAGAIARVRAQLPQADPPLSQRDAQLVLAREYGFAGWKDLLKEVKQRLGRGLEWAISEARRLIHDNDVEGLRKLLAESPALLGWRADENDGGLLGMATGSYGDSGDPFAEEHFTRLACAEILLDAGAVVALSVCDGLIRSRAKGLIDLFNRRGLLPRSLKFLAALGDVDRVRACLDTNSDDLGAVNEAFLYACHFQHETVAALLLDRAITLDAEMGRRIDAGPGRSGFLQYFISNKPDFVYNTDPAKPWQAYVQQQVDHAMRDGDLASFIDGLQREPWLLSDACVKFQSRLIEVGVLNDRAVLIHALFDLDPALLHCRVPPPSQAIEFAFTYVKTHLLPILHRIWPMPDDLPHAAGNGDLARVKRWFDAAGKPALGDLTRHFPWDTANYRRDLEAWFGRSEPNVQRTLDTALAWAVLNDHFEVADFLLAHGADINTNWGSHEPASILHELVWHKNYEAMQFLIDRGIDMTIVDYRWEGTAEGWAYHAAKDEKMAQWLAEAQQRQEQAPQ